jgi:phospholipid transport system substrate-binding protein
MKFLTRAGLRVSVSALVGVMLAASWGIANCAVAPPAMPAVKSLGAQILAMARDPSCQNQRESCRTRLRAIIEQHWDTTDMAKSALGIHWRNLTPAQQAQFTSLFAQLTESIYLSRSSFSKAQSYANTVRINYLKEIPQGDNYSQINTTILLKPGEQPIKVNYRLRWVDGTWKVYDIIVAEISLVGNYRNQFNRIINRSGYDDLVKALQQKIQQLNSENA